MCQEISLSDIAGNFDNDSIEEEEKNGETSP